MSCPDLGVLQAHVEGFATVDERETVRVHLEGCVACRQLVLALAPDAPPDDAVATTVRGHNASSPLIAEAGARIGRYVVLRKLGEGGMGVVYAAYDPELARQVALKLIRRASDATDAREVQDRLLREGQAMARMAHPNVVTVYDVGRHDDQVFVAMELIDGETLALWLARARRSTAEVIDRFLEAGRGLAAAHAAGLVHRDFKPNNVMIDRQGRVRVMDFGLARPAGLLEPSGLPSSTSRLEQTLTASNVLLGTPAYMAPEQLERAPTDARTDQFSFCVALYEALCETRPFVAVDTDGLRAAILDGQLQRPKRSVPRHLVDTVSRGLRPEPAERWPSIEALMEALSRDPSRRWWRAAGALAMLALLAATGVAYRHALHENRLLCAGSETKLSGVWDAARKEQLRSVFEQSRSPFAATSFATAAALLDRYAAAWTGARTDACQATRLRGEQSEELLDLRMMCLDDRLGQLSATIDQLARPDGVESAVQATAALPPLEGCGDTKALRERVPPPRDARQRADLERLRERLHRVAALYDAGKHAEALPEAEVVARDADASGYLPTSGEAHRRLAEILEALHRNADSTREFESAALAAERGHDDKEAAIAWNNLAFVVAVDESKPNEALRLLHVARAKLDRVGATDRDEELLDHNGAVINMIAGHYEQAVADGEKSVALGRKLDPDGVSTMGDLANLANLYAGQGHPDQAVPLLRQVVEVLQKKLGVEHPRAIGALENLGAALADLNRGEEALAVFDRAVALAEKSHASEVERGTAIARRALVLGVLHRTQEALVEDRRALAILEKAAPADDSTLVDVLSDLGIDELELGHAERALPLLERAVKTLEANQSRALDCADIRFALARAVYETGDHVRGRALAAASDVVFADAEKRLGGNFTDRRREIHDWQSKHR